jgi:formylglycine-generating enzyme required for sulfatase activity
MVRIPAGLFVMGAADDREDNGPPHTVYLDAFWLDRYEVTVGEYRKFLRRFPQPEHQPREPYGSMPPQCFTSPHYQTYPMVNVPWLAAQAYCAWKGKRLPTEAEWEKAARGSDGRIWPWGDVFGPERANVAGLRDGYLYTAPVGTYPAGRSPYGVDDLAGNVWECVADWYDPQRYARSPARNPTGPAQGTLRVVRGGCWFADERFARATFRNHAYPEARDNCLGFRCARSP